MTTVARNSLLVEQVNAKLTGYRIESALLAFTIGRPTLRVERWLRGDWGALDDEAVGRLRIFAETLGAVEIASEGNEA